MRQQKGKILSWIIFIFLLLIVFGALIFYQKISEAPEATEVIQEEAERKLPKGFAIPELSEEEKENLDNDAFGKAMQSGEGCEEIKYDEELKQACSDTLLYNSGIQKNDERLCEKIKDSDLKNKCFDYIYSNIAAKTFDEDLCNKIKHLELKQNCLDRIQASFGRTAKSTETCEVVEDENLKQNCLDDFYFSHSIENLSPESCENIVDIELKERCTKTVAKNIEVIEISKTQVVREYQTSEEKLAGCDQLSGVSADICKNEANYNLALEKKDLSYCNAITDTDKQNQCIRVQGANINNYYLRQATSKKDPSLCSKVLDEGLRTICLTYAQ